MAKLKPTMDMEEYGNVDSDEPDEEEVQTADGKDDHRQEKERHAHPCVGISDIGTEPDWGWTAGTEGDRRVQSNDDASEATSEVAQVQPDGLPRAAGYGRLAQGRRT